MTTHEFAPEILREYDIRGTVGENLNEADAYFLGLSFGTMIRRNGGNVVCVAYDGRDTSPFYEKKLIQGLNEAGVDVERVGLGPTPLLYFAVKDHMADGGIMITGSHNPNHMNGFKMTLQSGPVFGEAIKALAAIASEGGFASGNGSIREVDIKDIYIERLLRDMTLIESYKIAWDAGNGAAGAVLHKLVSKLPGEHILLYDTVDGSFPNHMPDPSVDENMKDLQRVVLEQNCDLGIAFDGDGDRIGVIDDKGNIIRSDMLLAVYARNVLETQPGASIIADVKCSNALFEEIRRLGGNAVMWKTGHSLIKSKMAELNAPLAGELSGHIFFADKYYGFDDALYCAVRLLHYLEQKNVPLSDLLSEMPSPLNTPELRVDVDEVEKFKIVEQLKSYLHGTSNPNIQIDETDGVRVTLDGGWWLLRASNTQACLVARAEADSKEALSSVKKHLVSSLSAVGFDLSFE